MVNKVDLAPHMGIDAALPEADAHDSRGDGPVVTASLNAGRVIDEIAALLRREDGL